MSHFPLPDPALLVSCWPSGMTLEWVRLAEPNTENRVPSRACNPPRGRSSGSALGKESQDAKSKTGWVYGQLGDDRVAVCPGRQDAGLPVGCRGPVATGGG